MEFSEACSELRTADWRAGGVTDTGGWVGTTVAVDGGRSVVGEGCSIVPSGVERWRPAAEAAGAETECSSGFICVAGGVSSAPSYP